MVATNTSHVLHDINANITWATENMGMYNRMRPESLGEKRDIERMIAAFRAYIFQQQELRKAVTFDGKRLNGQG